MSRVFDPPPELAAALEDLVAAHGAAAVTRATGRLIERYRADRPAAAGSPIVADPLDAVAYLAYRLPATYAAVRSALAQLPDGVEPAGQLDLGGGSGAAVWAAADRWPGLGRAEVRDVSAAALDLGARLARASGRPAVRGAGWTREPLGGPLPPTDLVTVSYVLGELDPATRAAVVDRAAEAARRLLVLVEPGSTAGHRRILEARSRLLAVGWRVLAPCPHGLDCPLAVGDDWCHVAARVNRTAVHRRAKQADRSFEDEKFSYVAFAPPGVAREDASGDASEDASAPLAAGRIVRAPREPKGRVQLAVCVGDRSAVVPVTVTKRDGELFRAARKVAWGDPWPPADPR